MCENWTIFYSRDRHKREIAELFERGAKDANGEPLLPNTNILYCRKTENSQTSNGSQTSKDYQHNLKLYFLLLNQLLFSFSAGFTSNIFYQMVMWVLYPK